MNEEKSVNIDEIIHGNKIKLVVTDNGSPDLPIPSPNSNPVVEPEIAKHESAQPIFDLSNAIADPDKVMRDLPVDEFFKVLERSTPEQLQTLIHTFEKGARTKGGTKLLQKVIDVPQEPRSLMSILMWWEWRRPLYNIAITLAGVPAAFALVVFLNQSVGLTIINALSYLFFANICYSLGAPAELVARTFYKDKAETYGPVLLTLGTIFSVLLTFMLEFVVVSLVALGLFHLF